MGIVNCVHCKRRFEYNLVRELRPARRQVPVCFNCEPNQPFDFGFVALMTRETAMVLSRHAAHVALGGFCIHRFSL